MLGLTDEVPLGMEKNIRYRREVNRKARDDPVYQRKLIERCTDDIFFYINTFVWQYNPNARDNEVGPFITWDFQVEAVKTILYCIREGVDLVIEKSRDMGASWLCLIVQEKLWHFHAWQKFLCVSRSADAVDEAGDPDSLFWKLDFIHSHQPDWLIKPQLGWKNRRKMGYKNYLNGSTITGEASTGKAGVGGRATAMFVDEFAQVREDYEVLHRTSDTTRCRIFNSTHLGLDTAFNELTQRVDMKRLQLHWTQHPLKKAGLYKSDHSVKIIDKQYQFPVDYLFVRDGTPSGGPFPGIRSPWYDEQCGRKNHDRRAIAMDLDINPSGAVSQFFDPMLIRRLAETYCIDPCWQGRIEIVDGKASLLPCENGPLKLWLNLTVNGSAPAGPYVGGGDISTGTGASPSCFTLANGETGEKVAELTHAFLEPVVFAREVVALCSLFLDHLDQAPMIVWEANGPPGAAFGKTVVQECGYRRIYMREVKNIVFRGRSEMCGWMSSVEEKYDLLNHYQAALRAGHFINRSKEALEECLAFRYDSGNSVVHSGEMNKNNPSGARLNHGDHVIADALAWKMARGMYAPKAVQQKKEPAVGSLAWRQLLHQKQESGWD